MAEFRICKKCKKQIPAVGDFCNWCGASQIVQKTTSYRPHDSGTVCKASGKRQLPYAAYLPRSMNRKFIGSFRTKTEASNALAVAIAARPSSKRAEWTVKDFYQFYISSKHFNELSVSQQKGMKAHWKYMSDISELKMKAVKTQEWQTCIDRAIELGRSKSVINKIKELASALCTEAMKDDVITRNYSKLLQMGGTPKKNRDTFTSEELALLKKHDSDVRVKFILILVYTGMRISELLELPVENVHEKYMVGGKKTAAGRNRIVPIVPEIAPYIEYFKRESGTLIHRNGAVVTVNYARNFWFYPALVELGILTADEIKVGGNPRITPHYARHTCSTLAREAGVPEDVIKRVMGHTDYTTTDEHYVEMQANFIYNEFLKISKG